MSCGLCGCPAGQFCTTWLRCDDGGETIPVGRDPRHSKYPFAHGCARTLLRGFLSLPEGVREILKIDSYRCRRVVSEPLPVLETARLRRSRRSRDVAICRFLFWDRGLRRDQFWRAVDYMFMRFSYGQGTERPGRDWIRNVVLYRLECATECDYYSRVNLRFWSHQLAIAEEVSKSEGLPCLK